LRVSYPESFAFSENCEATVLGFHFIGANYNSLGDTPYLSLNALEKCDRLSKPSSE